MENQFCMYKSASIVKKYLEKCPRIDCVIAFLQNMWIAPWQEVVLFPTTVARSGATTLLRGSVDGTSS